MRDELRKWVVNDYFTPNIKAEVILDALLTPYIAGIIKDQCKDQCDEVDAVFVTKEMSVSDAKQQEKEQTNENGDTKTDNRGTKIDYILANKQTVYLVELKTAEGSIEKRQAERYRDNCCGEGKTFGTVFGDKLLDIMSTKLKKTGEDWKDTKEPEKQLYMLFNDILQKYDPDVGGKPCAERKEKGELYAEQAKKLLKEREWGSTYKYLYTMGQLLDYLHDFPDRTLWDLPLKLIYITLNGESPHTLLKNNSPDFYLYPEEQIESKDKGSVSLKKAEAYLRGIQGDELAGLLADIIKELPETKEN